MRARALTLVTTIVAFLVAGLVAAPSANAEYFGARWEKTTICYTTKYIKSSKILTATRRAVADLNRDTKLKAVTRYDCYASGYSQRVVVKQKYYGRNGHLAYFTPKYKAWKKVKTKGPWTKSGYTWTFASPTQITVNMSYHGSYSTYRWENIIRHEVGHSVGLGHNGQRCDSNMRANLFSRCSGRMYGTFPWRDRVGYWTSDPGINQIYKHG